MLSVGEKFRPGATIGRYVVEREVGCGACGVVYCARDRGSGAPVALKLPRSAELTGTVIAAGAAQARVRHPGVVRVLAVERAGLPPHVVFEWVEGPTVQQWIERRGPLPLVSALPLFEQLLDALAAIHDRGAIHGDLKPSNLLIGSDGRLRLTDFGRGGSPAASLRLSPTGSTRRSIGTPAFLPPEHWQGRTDERTDIYAAGLVLFYLLTGRMPALHERIRLQGAERRREGWVNRLVASLCAPVDRRPRRVSAVLPLLRSPPRVPVAGAALAALALLPALVCLFAGRPAPIGLPIGAAPPLSLPIVPPAVVVVPRERPRPRLIVLAPIPRATCRRCAGRGRLACSGCDEQGRVKTVCPDCRSGRIDCARCAGLGHVTCARCDARGQALIEDSRRPARYGERWVWVRVVTRRRCPVCSGDRKLTCPDCAGRGTRVCGRCAGRGAFDQPHAACGGTRRLRCTACPANYQR